MRIIGCDLHARQQSVALLDTETGEVVNRTLQHEANQVREFYAQLPRPVLVGIEALSGVTQAAFDSQFVQQLQKPLQAHH